MDIKIVELPNIIKKSGSIFSYTEKINNKIIEVHFCYNHYINEWCPYIYYCDNMGCMNLYIKKENNKYSFLYDYNNINHKEKILYIIESIDYMIKKLYEK